MMSDGLYEAFTDRSNKKTPKTIEVNRHVYAKVFKDRVLIVNEQAGDQVCLKKATLKKLNELLYK